MGMLFLLLFCLVCAPSAFGQKVFKQSGVASWYGAWHHGKVTANGEAFDMFAMTAAHKKIPLGSLVKVTRKDNGRSIIVRINDRGPYKKRRILDLSYAAAESLGMVRKGVSRVSIEVVGDKQGRLLSDTQHFFVRVCNASCTPEAVRQQLSRLIRLGIHDAAKLLHTRDNVMAIGPFKTFADAQNALTRVTTTHPGAHIMLVEKDSMAPAVSAVAGK
jgi:rare lipoprotein A